MERDTLMGGAGDDIIVSNGGNNIISGGEGFDTLDMSQAHDPSDIGPDYYIDIEHFIGSRFDDSIGGNASDNIIEGGLGSDTLTGSGGADTFTFDKADDSFAFRAAQIGSDTITDFSSSEGDRIDLSGIDADAATSDDQAFHLIGDSEFSNSAGELRIFQVQQDAPTDLDHWMVQADSNGDGIADLIIQVDGHLDSGLLAHDFTL
jgi:Ca2+-binding RTX toxin-like protein